MRNNHLFRWFFPLFLSIVFLTSYTDGKGFGGRGGGGFKGGSRGTGSFGGSKSGGSSGSSSYNRGNNYGGYNSMNKPRSGSGFQRNAMSFGAGAAGGLMAYSLMGSMASSHRYRPGYYEPGYGGGETCKNNDDINGTVFGQFRCPLNGFPYEATSCCGEYGKQYCCELERSSGMMRTTSHFGWILLVVIISLVLVFFFVKNRRARQKDLIMVPVEPPAHEQQGPPFYHPAPPPMGYPPPPSGNPYGQQQMPFPPQQHAYNPYQAKEGGPPAYDEAIRNNQDVSTAKAV